MFKAKTVIITGSSRGLGRAFAIAFAKQGANVVINGTNATALAEVETRVQELGGQVRSVLGSVASMQVCENLIVEAVEAFGGVDILVNNAGIVRDRTLFKMTAEDFDDVIAVNLRGAWACAKFAAVQMREQGGGQIINVISASGLVGGFGQGNYAASKAGMMGLQRTWVLELDKFNIRCNSLWPIAQTDMTQVVFDRVAAGAKQAGKPVPAPEQMGFGKPEHIANMMLWLASEQAADVNGQCFTCSGSKIAVWNHPQEQAVGIKAAPWSVDEISAHFAANLLPAVYQPKLE